MAIFCNEMLRARCRASTFFSTRKTLRVREQINAEIRTAHNVNSGSQPIQRIESVFVDLNWHEQKICLLTCTEEGQEHLIKLKTK